MIPVSNSLFQPSLRQCVTVWDREILNFNWAQTVILSSNWFLSPMYDTACDQMMKILSLQLLCKECLFKTLTCWGKFQEHQWINVICVNGPKTYRKYTYMQFLVAKSLCTTLRLAKYSIPLAIWIENSIKSFTVGLINLTVIVLSQGRGLRLLQGN